MPDTPNTVRPGPERDEAAGYRPVSGVAVAAAAVAGISAVAVLGVWATAKVRGRPILVKELLPLAAVGVALAVVARWQLRRIGNARTGHGLASAALWVSLLALGGYGAYYFATDLAVRQQARKTADDFFTLMADGKPEMAFRLTRPPSQQADLPDAERVRARFGSTDLYAFNQADLPRTFRTWPDKVRFQFTGERERVDEADGFQVELNYVLRTPEGQFDVGITTRGFDDRITGGREWQVLFQRTGLRQDRQLTKLGRLCLELQAECARRFLPKWNQELVKEKPEAIAAIVRKEGQVLPAGERDKVAEELHRPGAVNIFPGAGPTRPPGLPTILFSPDAVRLVQVVEADAPTVAPNVPAWLTIRLAGDELVKEMLRLAGPGWEQQPLLPIMTYDPELRNYEFRFVPEELNLRPSQPRIGPTAAPAS
ncbi:MAG TPA: hypothetical protein VGF55_10920 [Gemmataceae bacterium]|jgi:hypothetical protein